MAKHKFGIFDIEPVPGKSYDEYSPEKYDYIATEYNCFLKISGSIF